jgi:hypothetical protein
VPAPDFSPGKRVFKPAEMFQWRDLRLPVPWRMIRSATALSFVISTEAQRSGEICGPAVLSWKCFLCTAKLHFLRLVLTRS